MCVNESEKTTVPGDSISVELSSSELSSLVQGAIGQGAIGQGANVQGATVRGVICQGAIVRGAIVKEQLSGSNCQGATVGTPLATYLPMFCYCLQKYSFSFIANFFVITCNLNISLHLSQHFCFA